jgi:hypothetical protein
MTWLTVPTRPYSAEESQSHLRAAICLEGAAHAYLRADPPMPRKFAIHLVLAGHRYNQVGLVLRTSTRMTFDRLTESARFTCLSMPLPSM